MKRTVWLACLASAAFAAHPDQVHPGTLNFLEGDVKVAGHPAREHAVAARNATIETGDGRAEILLTPGAYLRLDHQSSGRLVENSLTETQVELLTGHAIIEMSDHKKSADIEVIDHGVSIRLDKNGTYAFDASEPKVSVLKGQATVNEPDHPLQIKSHSALDLAHAGAQPASFNSYPEDSLYRWDQSRQHYLDDAAARYSRAYGPYVWSGWGGPGWYWNPYGRTYSYVVIRPHR